VTPSRWVWKHGAVASAPRQPPVEVFSNRMSREFLPGLIKPLVWSINIPLVNGAWIDLFSQLVGPTGLQPEDLARSVHFRAYFNMGAVARVFESVGFAGDSLELLMGEQRQGGKYTRRVPVRPSLSVLRHLPRLFAFVLGKLSYARQVQEFVESIPRSFRKVAGSGFGTLSEAEILGRVEELLRLNRKAAYHNIVVPLFMGLFNRLLKSRLSRSRIDYEELDTTSGLPGLERFSPNPGLEALRRRVGSLPEELRGSLSRGEPEGLEAVMDSQGEFGSELEAFLERFGHLRDSGNDFSSVPWREKPQTVLRMIAEGPAPHGLRSPLHWQELEGRGGALGRAVRRARRYLLLREAVSYTYTYGYGLFRDCFRALGERWAGEGLLDSWEDIHYLSLEEVRRIVDTRREAGSAAAREPAGWIRQVVSDRRAEMERAAGLNPPEVVYGREDPPLSPDEPTAERLSGIPTSRGYYTGRARVIRSADEFASLKPGEVLVIPYSDVAWTALFPKAGAVVSESGGMLSHSSIVAREYRIPCVVAVSGATAALENRTVRVDGYKGTVTVQGDSQ
jgi:phosphohistidine swiveling domain-containing protein